MLQVISECCTDGSNSDFCAIYNALSPAEQAELKQYLGDDCDGDIHIATERIDKRKPNFIRFGRSASLNRFGKKGSDPNFLRFGRNTPLRSSNGQNFLRFGRSPDPNFLRFGKSAEPNFLRFGKRLEMTEPNFLRFGRNNFLHFGRDLNDEFSREYRKPNFLRFGR